MKAANLRKNCWRKTNTCSSAVSTNGSATNRQLGNMTNAFTYVVIDESRTVLRGFLCRERETNAQFVADLQRAQSIIALTLGEEKMPMGALALFIPFFSANFGPYDRIVLLLSNDQGDAELAEIHDIQGSDFAFMGVGERLEEFRMEATDLVVCLEDCPVVEDAPWSTLVPAKGNNISRESLRMDSSVYTYRENIVEGTIDVREVCVWSERRHKVV